MPKRERPVARSLAEFCQAIDDQCYMALSCDPDSDYFEFADQPAHATTILLETIADLLGDLQGIFCKEASIALLEHARKPLEPGSD